MADFLLSFLFSGGLISVIIIIAVIAPAPRTGFADCAAVN